MIRHFICSLVIAGSASGQQPHLKNDAVDYAFFPQVTLSSHVNRGIVAAEGKSYSWEIVSEKLVMYDLDSPADPAITIDLSDSFRHIDKRWVTQLRMSNNMLLVARENKIILFALDEKLNVKEVMEVEADSHYAQYYLTPDGFYACDYEVHKNPTPHTVMYVSGNDKKAYFNYPQAFPNARAIQPNNHFDTNGEKLLVSGIFDYKIRLYSDGRLTDSIEYAEKSDFENPLGTKDSSFLSRKVLSLTDISSYCQDLLKKKARIWNVFYLNDSTIFVRTTQPEKNNRSFRFEDHVWRKTSEWKLIRSVNHEDFFEGRLNNQHYSEFSWPYFVGYSTLLKDEDQLCFFFWSDKDLENDVTLKDNHDLNKTIDDLILKQTRYKFIQQ